MYRLCRSGCAAPCSAGVLSLRAALEHEALLSYAASAPGHAPRALSA